MLNDSSPADLDIRSAYTGLIKLLVMMYHKCGQVYGSYIECTCLTSSHKKMHSLTDKSSTMTIGLWHSETAGNPGASEPGMQQIGMP